MKERWNAQVPKKYTILNKMTGRNLQDNNDYLGERHFPDLQNVVENSAKYTLKIMWIYMCYFS